jgi:hypothetical protein
MALRRGEVVSAHRWAWADGRWTCSACKRDAWTADVLQYLDAKGCAAEPRTILISGLRAMIDRGHAGTFAQDLEERARAYFGEDWPAPGSFQPAPDACECGRPTRPGRGTCDAMECMLGVKP